jgi:putative hydrolase of HD superfamily
MTVDRVARQIGFLIEADKLKTVLRRTPILDRSRRENSAEHSWHLMLAALVLREHLSVACDLLHALQLLVVHDLVEIDAGDTFAFDRDGQATKAERERVAAERLFGLLPSDQAGEFRALWDEFESHDTAEARFAHALDRIQPFLLNAWTGGGSWLTHDVTREQVLRRMAPVETTMPAIWPTVMEIVDVFCASGLIRT